MEEQVRKFEVEPEWKPVTESSIQNFHQEEQSLPALLPGLGGLDSEGPVNNVGFSPSTKQIEVNLDL